MILRQIFTKESLHPLGPFCTLKALAGELWTRCAGCGQSRAGVSPARVLGRQAAMGRRDARPTLRTTNDERRMTNAAAFKDSKGRKARPAASRRRPGCRECPFRAPSGECLDQTIRSGRCGSWVFYVLPGGAQGRCLWVKPRDPRTPKQHYWRARLGAASRNYSASLTDERQDACIAAGAKLRSRPRLGQWGWLTGQQYWVGQECTGKTEPGVENAEKCSKGLQTKGISLPTWDTHRSACVAPPGQHREPAGRANHAGGRPTSAVRLWRTGRKNHLVGTFRRNVRVRAGADASARRPYPCPRHHNDIKAFDESDIPDNSCGDGFSHAGGLACKGRFVPSRLRSLWPELSDC